MKYIDAEKLLAVLERQNVDKKVIQPLIRIIDSLQQEQPEIDLMKEINEYMSCEDNNPFDWDWRDKQACARHFYELGFNARKEE